MAIYHINKEGQPGVCMAEPGNCPMGTEYHFDNITEANNWSGIYSEFMVKKNDLVNNVYDINYRLLFEKTHEKRELQTFERYIEKEKDKWGEENMVYINPNDNNLDKYRKEVVRTLTRETEDMSGVVLSNNAFHYIIESPDKIIGFTSNNQLLDGIMYNKVTGKTESWEVKSLDNYGAQISQTELDFNKDGSVNINQEAILGEDLNNKINHAMSKYRSSSESSNFSRSNPKLDLSERDVAEYFIKHHADKGMRSLHLYDSNKGINQYTEIKLNYMDKPSEENLQKDIDNIIKTTDIQLNIRQNYSETIDFNEERDLQRFKDNYKDSFNTFYKDSDFTRMENEYVDFKKKYKMYEKQKEQLSRYVFSDEFRKQHGRNWDKAKKIELNRGEEFMRSLKEKDLALRKQLAEKKESLRYTPTEFSISDLNKQQNWVKIEERPRSQTKPRRTVLQIGEFYKEFNNVSLKQLKEMKINISELGVQKPKLTGVIKSKYENDN